MIKKFFNKLDKTIDKFYRPFANWLISLNTKEDIDWLNMHNNMIEENENERL